MSEWYEVKDENDLDLSDDGKFIHILFNTNHNGNQYVEIPVGLLVNFLDASKKPAKSGVPPATKLDIKSLHNRRK